MSLNTYEKKYDIVVVGGGLSGMCAAIAAARHGAKTAIIQNRSMFGGNASSEVRMHIVGASSHGAKADLAETRPTIEAFAAVEGLDGHGRAATIRFKSDSKV